MWSPSCFSPFIGGQQKYLPAVTTLMAPYVNSYGRLVPRDSAPINDEWGQDNYSAGLRIPQSEPNARRLKNRIAGADADPYLAIAGSLAAGYLGLVEEVTPRAEVCGDAHNMPRELPNSLNGALTSFLGAPQLHEVLGPDFVDVYATVKAHEFEEFMRVVTPWEREHLLLTV